MPGISDSRLRRIVLGSLPEAQEIGTSQNAKPFLLEIPDWGRFRIYLWTTTPDRSATGRSPGEHKAQIILPGTPRGSRQYLSVGDVTTALLGYSPIFGVFTAWQAELHRDSGYSKNLQFREELLAYAAAFGWAVGTPRSTAAGREVRIAFHPVHLEHYLRVLREADAGGYKGERREAFFIKRRPPQVPDPNPGPHESLVQQERRRVMSARLYRESAFSRKVSAEYGGACAVCAFQLSVTDGAHIIPVHDARSTDEIWNGVCLCANHHRLYESRILRITGEAVVQQNSEEVSVLRELNLLTGYESIIAPFLSRPIRLPQFYRANRDFQKMFLNALRLMDVD